MIQKHFYEAPEAEILLVKFEGNFCETNGDDVPGGIPKANPNDLSGEF